MKQIYNFEQHTPPVLNENMLRAEVERRKVKAQTMMLAVAALLMQVAVLILSATVMKMYPWLTVLCLVYVVISTSGAGVVAAVYTKKGGDL